MSSETFFFFSETAFLLSNTRQRSYGGVDFPDPLIKSMKKDMSTGG